MGSCLSCIRNENEMNQTLITSRKYCFYCNRSFSSISEYNIHKDNCKGRDL